MSQRRCMEWGAVHFLEKEADRHGEQKAGKGGCHGNYREKAIFEGITGRGR